jgi:spore maturation protein CgeB
MKLVVFGLSVSSSWGNGHPTLWRGLIRVLTAQGHRVGFYERDLPYYTAHRDLAKLEDAEFRLHSSWDDILPRARKARNDAALHGYREELRLLSNRPITGTGALV